MATRRDSTSLTLSPLKKHITRTMSVLSQSGDIAPASGSGDARSRSTAVYLVPLIALTAIYTVGLSLIAVRRLGSPEHAGLLYALAFSLLLTYYVRADRRVRDFRVPFEFDVFVYFAWPIFVPYYLFRTRGWIGLVFGVGICVMFAAPILVAATVATILLR